MLKIIVLGCGASLGVPAVPDRWGQCDPTNIKNRRTRPSIILATDKSTILVDTSPDLRQQLIRENIGHLDAILYTHQHADHVHGIDDIRALNYTTKIPIPTYLPAPCYDDILRSFPYMFQRSGLNPGVATPLYFQAPLIPHKIHYNTPFDIAELRILPFRQEHGRIPTLGFRVGDFAYSTDVVDLPDEAFDILRGVKVWIVDALRYKPHETHAHLDKALEWIKRVHPAKAYLTHMSTEMDYDHLMSILPSGVEPAYDGLSFTV